MGLAEPKKRRKISHDPRNLAWSSQALSSSYGHRLMTRQGWSEGQALGARDSSSDTKKHKHHSGLATDAERLAAARVGVLFKDDNLGLGAKRKGAGGAQNVEDQRTGLDAFQGLLGRLNGKSDDVLRQEEKKVEERRLEMFFKGRWGGMVFVKGGVLVGSDKIDGASKEGEEQKEDQEEKEQSAENDKDSAEDAEREEKRRQKEEKRQRKEERRKRREEKALRKAAKQAKTRRTINNESESESEDESTSHPTTPTALPLPKHKSPITLTQPPDEPVSSPAESDVDVASSVSASQKRKRKSDSSPSSKTKSKSKTQSQAVVTPTPSLASAKSVTVAAAAKVVQGNGRHVLRGRNIMAKKMVLSDAKGLDQIFMR